MLKARVFTALFLVAGFLAALFWLPHIWAALLFAAIAVLAAREWAALLQAGRVESLALVGLVAAACLAVWLVPYPAQILLWGLAVLFWCLIAPLWLGRGWRLAAHRGVGIVLGAVLIVAAWSALSSLHARSPGLLLAAMAVVWIADSGAYFSGRAFGRRKLAPAISPGKTWEGVYGGIVGVLCFGALLADAFAETRALPWYVLLPGLAAMTAISVVGDLFESLAKRQAGLKDSGNLLPGHGGVLDRIDSLLPTLPLAALALEWV